MKIEVTQEMVNHFRRGWDPDEDDQCLRNGIQYLLTYGTLGDFLDAALRYALEDDGVDNHNDLLEAGEALKNQAWREGR